MCSCVSDSFCDFVPEEEADLSSISKDILHELKWKKNLNTYKMYKKTLIYLISRLRYLILAMKAKKSTYKSSLCVLPMQLISNLPLHFQKRLYRFFNWRAIAKGDYNVKGVYSALCGPNAYHQVLVQSDILLERCLKNIKIAAVWFPSKYHYLILNLPFEHHHSVSCCRQHFGIKFLLKKKVISSNSFDVPAGLRARPEMDPGFSTLW